jgi:hypothetical protein
MKKILIYTLPKTGTHFLAFCFGPFLKDITMTHDKNKKHTLGEEINYKEYDVFVSLRNPKDTIISSLQATADRSHIEFSKEQLTDATQKLINEHIIYFIDILENENFYILKFEDFTINIKDVLLKLIKYKNFQTMVVMEDIVKNNPLYNDPLKYIRQNKSLDKNRFPRVKYKTDTEKFYKIFDLEDIKTQLTYVEYLYNKGLYRYNRQ